MTNDRIGDEIARLMDEAFEALRAEQWGTVEERARAVIAFDPDHEEASRLLIAAARMLEGDAESEAPDTLPAVTEGTATAAPDAEDDAAAEPAGASPTPSEPSEPAEPAAPAAPAPATPVTPVAAATGPGRTGKVLRGTGRVAFAVIRPLLAPVIIPLIVVVGALVVADQRGVWDADGPLADSGLVDGDGLLVRWRIAGNDRLI
jgi:hypothetical protein